MTSEKKILRSLFSIIFLDQLAITITFPLVTLIFLDSQSRLFPADTSEATRSMWYGICIGLPFFINMVFAPLLSALSDEFGRKKILLIEIFCATLFTLAMGFGVYWGILAFIFLGFIIRGAFCRTNPTALAIIGDTVSKEKKFVYMGYLQFAISAGAAIGPIIGGFLATRYLFNVLNFSLPFFLAAILALINSICVLLLIRETLQSKPTKKGANVSFQAIKKVLLYPDVLKISLILLLIQISWSTYYQFTPPILKTLYHFSANQLGWFMGMVAVWLAVASTLGVKIFNRIFTTHQMLLASCYLVLAGLIMTLLSCTTLFSPSGFMAWAGAIPIATGDVIAYSCLTALYSNAVRHEEQGKVMGISFIITGLVWGIVGFIGGFLMGISPLLPLMVAPIGIISALTLMHAPFGKKMALDYHYSV